MPFVLIDWIDDGGNTIIDNTDTIIQFNVSTVLTNRVPVLYYTSSKRVFPGKKIDIYGANLSGNIVVRIVDGGLALRFINDNTCDFCISEFVPFFPKGIYTISVAYFENIENELIIGEYSNELTLYNYESLEDALREPTRKYSSESYLKQLFKLWKPGKYALRQDSNIGKLLRVLGKEFEYYNDQAYTMLKETNPVTTDQFLSLWENEYGLPEECVTSPQQDLEYRKNQLLRKYSSVGGSSAEYFERIAAIVGFDISVTSESVDITTCEDTCEDTIIDEANNFVWYVDVFGATQFILSCEDTCEDPIDDWGTEEVECFLNSLKPSHTIIYFRYNISYNMVTDENDNIVTNDDDQIIT